jgi:SagB-type dehydrogenase family enzyme
MFILVNTPEHRVRNKTKNSYVFIFLMCFVLSIIPWTVSGGLNSMKTEQGEVIALPKPVLKDGISVEEALSRRDSVRSFSAKALTDKQISQLLWSAQGKTRRWGGRTAPSAGALYPLELYIATPDGVYRYNPDAHQLILHLKENVSIPLTRAALGQGCVREAPAVIIIAAVYERTTCKYGERGERYVAIEVGHAAENILLQAVSLGLGAVPVGAFSDRQLQEVLHLPPDHEPLYLIPVGHRR